MDISLAAQQVAPKSGSAFIQSTAQGGRAWAKLGAGRGTRDALGRVEPLVSPLPAPAWPEHHYRYDAAESDAYTATTLAWAGHPAAEELRPAGAGPARINRRRPVEAAPRRLGPAGPVAGANRGRPPR